MYCMYIYKRLLTDQFCITKERLTKITFVKTICLSIFFGLFQALQRDSGLTGCTVYV